MSQVLRRPDDADLRAAEALFHAGRHQDAMAECDRALAADPDHRRFLLLRAVLAIGAGDATTGEARLRRLIALAPDDAQAQQNLGALLAMRGQLDDAVTHFQHALAAAPDDLGTILNFARALRQLGRLDEAEKLLRRAADAHPTRAEPLHSLGLIEGDRHRSADAVALLEQASARAPRSASILADLGSAYRVADRLEPALDAYRRALAIDPTDDVVPARLCHQLERACSWSEADALRVRLLDLSENSLAAGKRCAELPFAQLAYQDDPAKILRLARAWSSEIAQRAGPPLPPPDNDRDPDRRLRIGFLSHDFRSHAVAELARGVLAGLDRSSLQVTGWSTGPDDGSALRRVIEDAVDDFRDIAALPHREAAQAIRAAGTDILVDLTGHTAGSRLEIAALRPAPVQASWLGYPGTTGATFIDWLIADAIVVPHGAERFYSEAVCRLPNAYLPLDDAQPIAAAAPSRASQRLPETGFVFCSFNNMHKIEPVMFGVWMDLLRAVPGSVLWLHAYNDLAARNLRAAASGLGIDPARLVFADRPAKAAHLARAGLAGLALDTRLYNGHTTTIDMLWAGVPVVTLPGKTFQARVSASLLTAAGLSNLIARDLDDYRRIALTLAREPAMLSALKAQLAANRRSAPLFDTARFARQLETAFRAIWQRHCAGQKPVAFDIGEAT